MKFIFSFSILFAPIFAMAFDCGQTPADLQAYEQTKQVDCQLRDIAQKINEGKDVVPKYLFHFGKKEYMDEDIAARNIPQKSWDDFVMSDKTRFHLESNRRGLYGTAGIDTNGFGGGMFNGLIQIQLKDECLNPKNVVTFYDMPKSERFKKWFS